MEDIHRIRFFNAQKAGYRIYSPSMRLAKADKNGHSQFHLEDAEKLLDFDKNNFYVGDQRVRRAIAGILRLNGVVTIYAHPYHLAINIALAFSWEDIHDDIIKILSEELFPGKDVDIQDRTVKEEDGEEESGSDDGKTE